jgi:hypothetical protein
MNNKPLGGYYEQGISTLDHIADFFHLIIGNKKIQLYLQLEPPFPFYYISPLYCWIEKNCDTFFFKLGLKYVIQYHHHALNLDSLPSIDNTSSIHLFPNHMDGFPKDEYLIRWLHWFCDFIEHILN